MDKSPTSIIRDCVALDFANGHLVATEDGMVADYGRVATRIENWHRAAGEAGDLATCEAIDALGKEEAGTVYAAMAEERAASLASR